MSKEKSSSKPKSEQSGPVKLYLTAYNIIQTIGWGYLLYLLASYHLSEKYTRTLYETVKWPLIVFQNAAVLEVVHAATRLVPSNPIITAVQVWSRVFMVCGVILATQGARVSAGLHLALAAWSITEIIRYGNYAFNLLGNTPYIVTWLRYTTFIILYPIGVTGELMCMYAAQEEVGKTQIFTLHMPNRVNFIFDYQLFLWITMLLYIPSLLAISLQLSFAMIMFLFVAFPQLYLHMWTLRRKVLGGGQQKKIN